MPRSPFHACLFAVLTFSWLSCSVRAQTLVTPVAPYGDVARKLEQLIGRQVEEKGFPALSIALVDDQDIVWAKGFGYQDQKEKIPATAETIYRVGSVSKLFTDIGIMQQVEKGALDLDAPIAEYLPEFRPENPFDKPITLRQLMSHHSGLVREPPVGHYFDNTDPTLAGTVASMNKTRLVYTPEERLKYSNAGISVVGYVLEHTQREPFASYLHRTLLKPLGLKNSGFAPTPELRAHLASAIMWTYHGRVFDAPDFQLGMAPAGSMYSSVLDLARFQSVLFAYGRGPNGQLLRKETLEQMWKPQFAEADAKSGCGLGFFVSELAGKRRIGHGGAMYGFATDFAALPDEKLGVIVAISKDVANAVARRITDKALRMMLAVREGKPLPEIEETRPVPVEMTRRLAGRYENEKKSLELIEHSGRLFLFEGGNYQPQLSLLGDELITDSTLSFGRKIKVDGEELVVDSETYRRVEEKKPVSIAKKWAGLIGEYGWEHNLLYILERDGKLYALIEWFFYYPLEEESEDVYRFPDYGLYHNEKVVFHRDETGRATEAIAAGLLFSRRPIHGENGVFRIRPQRPIETIRSQALKAKPPQSKGEFAKPDLVSLPELDSTIKLDVRYATNNNFIGVPFYKSAKAYLQRPAAEALVRVNQRLKKQGYGLLIHDAYRPWHVTKMFWDATPSEKRLFVADPMQGSRHNRGCAVDLTLYDLETGKAVAMTSGYDEFTDRAYAAYPGGTSLQRWHRDVLRRAMEEEGFSVYEAEWWHFDYKDWKKYGIMNVRFEQLSQGAD